MHRRALLASLGLATAGCLAPADDRADTAASQTADPTDTATATDSADHGTDTTTDTSVDYPEIGVPSDEAGGPPFDDDVDRVVWWGDERPDSPVRLAVDRRSGSLPEATFGFSLVNDSDLPFAYNPYNWGVWKRVDGSWYSVAPRVVPDPLSVLSPGSEHAWRLTVDADRSLPDSQYGGPQGSESVTIGGLGGGTYAFETDGWFEGQDYRDSTGLAVRFVLDGDPLTVTLDDSVTETSRGGSTVTVRTDVQSTAETRPCVFVLERDDDPEAERRIPEQIVRDPRLRKTLPAFEPGVDTVRLVEPNGTVPPFGVNDPWTFRFRGTAYRVTARELETETETETET